MVKSTSEATTWQKQTHQELAKIEQILINLGYTLEKGQPHIQGERFLMTKDKFVLIANNKKTNKNVVIKVSNKSEGIKEILNEKNIRDILTKTSFASDNILLPKEIYCGNMDGYLFWIAEYIPQEMVFAAYPLKNQFFMTMRIFEEQEAFNTSTFEHLIMIKNVVPLLYAKDYLKKFKEFETNVSTHLPGTKTSTILKKAYSQLEKQRDAIDQYCGYMSHTDLAPSNFRVFRNDIYYLDLSSVLFGSKHESWARFMNWALLHSPELEPILNKYIKDNRPDELESLRLMRIYKAGFLINYYADAVRKTSGDLNKLENLRLELWTEIMKYFLDEDVIPATYIKSFELGSNKLRTPEERERQKEFNLIRN